MIRKKQSGVNGWIAANGGRETARIVLTYMATLVAKIEQPLLQRLVDEYGDELPDFAIAHEILTERNQDHATNQETP